MPRAIIFFGRPAQQESRCIAALPQAIHLSLLVMGDGSIDHEAGQAPTTIPDSKLACKCSNTEITSESIKKNIDASHFFGILTMRKKIARHSALVVASLFICLRVDFFIASAQVQHGRLMGRILDKSGNPISGATIYITCQSATQAAVSNAQGYYTFLNVPPETYKIKAYRRGFNDWLSNISVNANAITRIDVKLAASTSDAVTALVDNEKEEKDEKRNASVAFRKVIPIVRKKEPIEVIASAPEKEKIAAELKSENEDERAAQALINLTDENLNADAIEQTSTLESPVSIIGGVESVYKHVKYPELAVKAGVEGKVVAHIFVDKEGNILKVDFLKNINPILDAEVMRVLTEETKFQAAKLTNGQTIASAIIVPFNFKIKK